MSSHPSKTCRIILEVERKFRKLAVPRLTFDAGQPHFSSLLYLGQHTFHDAYFDHTGKLSSSGVWVRKRQHLGREASWEAKLRQGGTFNNSMFQELTDVGTIAQRVHELTGLTGKPESNFGLKPMAMFTTSRESWLANDTFKIVLDSTDFGHLVGEVELEQMAMFPANRSSDFDEERWKSEITKEMDLQIERFMRRYSWAFRVDNVKGKLSAYFETHPAETQ